MATARCFKLICSFSLYKGMHSTNHFALNNFILKIHFLAIFIILTDFLVILLFRVTTKGEPIKYCIVYLFFLSVSFWYFVIIYLFTFLFHYVLMNTFVDSNYISKFCFYFILF